jgi:acetylornithine deacetylase/succinyl-diaminopimelate desuccinylase-like protein
MSKLEQALQYSRVHHQDFLSLLEGFIRIPSVSNNPDHAADMLAAADWLKEQLTGLGCSDVRSIPTAGHPVVYASLSEAEAGVGVDLPTLLVYGHYDVQPAENENAWESPAYTPQIRGDSFYGRGASDMKGQIVAILAALQSILAQGSLRANLKFVFEGEEEIGSPNLQSFLIEYADLLESDIALNLDVGFLNPKLPTISYGLRGIASFELFIQGPKSDLHSGVFGGVVHNPALVLSTALAGLFDEQGTIQIPHFYDNVLPMSDDERAELSNIPLDASYYLDQSGAPELWGETGFSPTERIAARPTCEINGLKSGYLGEGEKTIIPSQASAKITARLVPNQSPHEVHQQLRVYFENCLPPSVTWQLEFYSGGNPFLAEPSHPEIQAFADALESSYGQKAVYFRDGGSIPAAVLMKDNLGLDSILSGFGLPTDNIHAPDEHIHCPTWYRGIETLIHFLVGV